MGRKILLHRTNRLLRDQVVFETECEAHPQRRYTERQRWWRRVWHRRGVVARLAETARMQQLGYVPLLQRLGEYCGLEIADAVGTECERPCADVLLSQARHSRSADCGRGALTTPLRAPLRLN